MGDNIRTALRTLFKYKSFTIINLIGLTVGKAVFLLILGYVLFEHSFDKFHSGYDKIYRITMNEYSEGSVANRYAITFPAVGPALKSEFSEVKDYVRLYTESTYGPIIFNYTNAAGLTNKLLEQRTYYADANFFTFFSFPLISGDPETVLSEPNFVVLSKQAASRMFKNEDPIGKILTMHDRGGAKTLKVTGIAEDVPAQSHFKFDYIVSHASLGKDDWCNTSWDFNDFTTYVSFNKPVEPGAMEKRLNEFVNRHTGQNVGSGTFNTIALQPLAAIHLTSDLTQELDINGNKDVVNYLLLTALFILFISWINYINMSTAVSNERAREVSIRKVLGSNKVQIVKLFMSEAFLVNLCAITLALILTEWLANSLSSYMGLTVHSYMFDFSSFHSTVFNLAAVLLFIAGTFCSGIYPSLRVSSFESIEILRGGKSNSPATARYRNVLVVFQFMTTFVLLAFVLAIYSQINFMKESDLGFDIDNMLIVQAPRVVDSQVGYEQSLQQFKSEMLKQSIVTDVSISTLVPGIPYNWTASIRRENRKENEGSSIYLLGVDRDFTRLYNMKMVAGIDYAGTVNESNNTGIILNESAVKMLGFASPADAVGAKVILWNNDLREIIGVVKNFNQESMRYSPQPYVLFLFSQSGYFSVKLASNNFREGRAAVSNVWNKAFPDNPVNHFELKEFYNQQYKGDYQFGQTFTGSALLIIIISFIGLFGLLTFFINRSAKEIALRKVLGASSLGLWTRVYAHFLKLICAATLVALPLSYWVINSWLERYSSRVDVSVLFFIVPLLFIVIISVMVVAISFFRINSINPADTIRNG
jgi:putative ABC transport system permease protein